MQHNNKISVYNNTNFDKVYISDGATEECILYHDEARELCRQLIEQGFGPEDAYRYNWLKNNRAVLLITGFFGNGCVNKTITDVDTAIDTAMAAAPQPPKEST